MDKSYRCNMGWKGGIYQKKLYETVVRPATLYGLEAVPLALQGRK